MENKNKKSAAERDIEILLGVNPDFHGNRINPQALAKVEKLKEHAEAIRRINPKIVCDFDDVEDKTEQSWGLSIDIPSPFFSMAKAINERMAEMIRLSDSIACARVESANTIRFSYNVHNLWEE